MSDLMETLGEFEDRTGRWLVDLRPRRHYVAVAAAGVLLAYLGSVTSRWAPASDGVMADSAQCLGVSRSLARGEGYVFNGRPTLSTAPVVPTLLSPFQGSLGLGNYWAANLLMALCGLGALWLMYRSLSRWTDRWTVLLVTLATAFSYGFFATAHRVLTDMPATAVFWLVVYTALRGRDGNLSLVFSAGVMTVAAVATQWSAALAVAALGVALVVDRQATLQLGDRQITGWPARVVSGGVVLAALVVVAWAVIDVAQVNRLAAPASLTLSGASFGRWYEGLMRLPTVYGDLLICESQAAALGGIGLLLAAVGAIRFWWSGRQMVTTLATLYLLLLMMVHGGAYGAGDLAMVLPLLFLLTADGLCWCVDLVSRERHGRPATARGLFQAMLVFAALVVLPNGVRVARDVFYHLPLSLTAGYYDTVRGGRSAVWFDLGQMLRRGTSEPVAAADPGAVAILHWLGDCPLVAWSPQARRTADDADAALQLLDEEPRVTHAVVDLRRGADEYNAALTAGFIQDRGWTLIYNNRDFAVFARDATVGGNQG